MGVGEAVHFCRWPSGLISKKCQLVSLLPVSLGLLFLRRQGSLSLASSFGLSRSVGASLRKGLCLQLPFCAVSGGDRVGQGRESAVSSTCVSSP